MSGRFINPYPQFLDSTPSVYSGGSLYFYASGTSTLLSTYTTKALAVANTNPVVLNSAGRPATDIFLQDLEYKVVLKDSNGVTIWTADPVSHRDSALVAKTLTGNGSPNGAVAGTAGSSSILPDFYWDYTGAILYVCTTTGTASTAVWTAVNASTAAAVVPTPQGYLTVLSGLPIITTDQTANNFYYTPYVGNIIPIWNGTTFVPTVFTEIGMSITASQVANSIYDVFVFSNSGVLTMVTGPAWTNVTAGSCARGTGAGTTQLTRVNGLWVNAVSMTARNGASTYTVPASQGTYVGSLYIDTSAGLVTCHRSYGQSRKWGVWNAYNRAPIFLKAGDATASWTYASSATVRPANNSTSNKLTVFAGLTEEPFSFRYSVLATTDASAGPTVGIGFNVTNAISGFKGLAGTSSQNNLKSEYDAVPSLGINNITAVETSASGTTTFFGTEAQMLLTGAWRG